MPREYNMTFSGVSVSAAQDLVFIPGVANKLVRIIKAWVACSNTTLATGQDLQLRARYIPATVTAGTGGTTGATPSKTDQGDAACSISTAGVNNTGKATTSGTAVVLFEGGTHLYAPFEWDACLQPVPTSTAFVWELLSTVSGTVSLSGGVRFQEIG